VQWPAPVLRIALRWDGERWGIDGETRVPSMTLPAADVLPAGEKTRGFWIEVVDRAGRVRHRRIIADPLAGMESFEANGTITRMPDTGHEVTSEILVPDFVDATELHLVSNRGTRGEHARESRTVLKLHSHGNPGPDTSADRDESH